MADSLQTFQHDPRQYDRFIGMIEGIRLASDIDNIKKLSYQE